MKKSTVSGSLGNASGKTGEEIADPEDGRATNGVQGEKRVEVTADLPFDFTGTPDTTAVLWEKLGLPLPNLDANEGQRGINSIQFETPLQRRLYRGGTGIRKGTLLENRRFGADYQEFAGKNAEPIYRAIEKLPFRLSQERINAFAKVTMIGLYQFRTSQQLLRGLDERTKFDEFLIAAEIAVKQSKIDWISFCPQEHIRFGDPKRRANVVGACWHRDALQRSGVESANFEDFVVSWQCHRNYRLNSLCLQSCNNECFGRPCGSQNW